MGAELDKLIREQQVGAMAATLFTVGLDGVKTVCKRWAGPFGDPADLLEEAEERAMRQVNTLGGVQSFLFELYDGAGASLGTEVFRLSAEALSGDRSILSEPANEGGIVAQLMRHTEALAHTGVLERKETTLAFREVMAQQRALIALSHQRSELAENKYLEALKLFSEVMTGERETAVELERAKGNADSKRMLAEKVSSYIPYVLASFVQKGPAKAPAHATAIGVKNLFESLTQEQVATILTVLQPEQQRTLFSVFESAAATEQAPAAPQAPSASAAVAKNGVNGAH